MPSLLLSCFFCLLMALCAPAALSAPSASVSDEDKDADRLPSDMPGYSMGMLRELADRVQRTGVGMDMIPALYRPQYLSISDANLSMDNEDIVFLVQYPDNRVRVYPRRVLVWHEVVNDVLPDADGMLPPAVPGVPEAGGDEYCISYAPLTGSVVGFRSRAGKYPSSFGVSGHLLNGNSILYDRISRSLWSQLLGTCIEGPFKGKRLERIPVISARWKGVKERFGGLNAQFDGKVEVLSRSTGFKRSYGKDPYGSYHSPGTYYDNNQMPFVVDHIDTRLPPKKRILGLETGSAFGAVQKDAVRQMRVLNFTLGLTPMVALHDEELDAVLVFDRRLANMEQPLSFVIFEDKLIDEQTRSEWLPTGKSTFGKLREQNLTPVLALDSMWFAWASFHPNTQIFPSPGR
ncbi:DUF3179 domain-containing protein [Desulfovibrio sp. OttesenSCG-928-F20]|nr:DUF3179 domain-containing protein [Desulfovibrio sp. OttesenSCG-928-F20]